MDLLNKANDILTQEIAEQEGAENILCPLGEVIENVEDLDVEG